MTRLFHITMYCLFKTINLFCSKSVSQLPPGGMPLIANFIFKQFQPNPMILSYLKSNISRAFLDRLLHIWTQKRHHHGWCQGEKNSKFLPLDTIKMHSLALPVLRFFSKTFPILLKFTLQNIRLHGWALKNSYIQVKILCDYKLVRPVKQSELTRCSN